MASRLRVLLGQRGFLALPPRTSAPLDGIAVVIRLTGPATCCIHSVHPEALPDELGGMLSEALRCRTTTLLATDVLTAYEAAEQGRSVEKLVARGNEILEEEGSSYVPLVTDGRPLLDCLRSDGMDGLDFSFEQAATTPRALCLAFAPKPGGKDQEVIEIDPLLSCPSCGEAMRAIDGGFGRFYGCVRYPDCRGRLTEKQAEQQRN